MGFLEDQAAKKAAAEAEAQNDQGSDTSPVERHDPNLPSEEEQPNAAEGTQATVDGGVSEASEHGLREEGDDEDVSDEDYIARLEARLEQQDEEISKVTRLREQFNAVQEKFRTTREELNRANTQIMKLNRENARLRAQQKMGKR